MRLSHYKISIQLLLIMATFTLLICGLMFALMVWSLNTVSSTASQSMTTIKDNLDKSGETMGEALTKSIETLNENSSAMVTELSITSLENLASGIVGQVKSRFEVALDTARTLATAIEGYRTNTPHEELQREDLCRFLSGVMNGHLDDFVGVWIAFEPNAFDNRDESYKDRSEFGCDVSGQFIPWFYNNQGKVDVDLLVDPYTSDYYATAKKTGQEYLTAPYPYAGTTMVSAAVPIIVDGKTLGVAGVDMTMKQIDDTLKTYKPYGNGFVYLVSGTGVFAWHPNQQFVTDKVKLASVQGRENMAKAISEGKRCTEIISDLNSGKELYQVVEPVQFGNCPDRWGIVVSADREDVLQRLVEIQQRLHDLGDDAEKQIDSMNESMTQTDLEAHANLEADRQNAQMVAGISVLMIVLVCIVAAVIIGRSFSAPLMQGVMILRSVAEKGDLSVKIPQTILSRGDEIGDVGRGIQQILQDYSGIDNIAQHLAEGDWCVDVNVKSEADSMDRNLAGMLDQVNAALSEIDGSVTEVQKGAIEVNTAVGTLSDGAQQSASSLEEITASMAQISSQTSSNAQNAQEASQLAQQATEAAKEGQKTMNAMNGAMERIMQNANQIQHVIKVIDDIAFQTNLLALNAAVEAARAGVHGKGFAVVAEEVRNLAARSAKAAQETTELITTSGNEIERGVKVSSQTSETLNSIADLVRQTTTLVSGIAVASNEQAQGVSQIAQGLQQIDAVTQQNTAAAEQCAAAAGEMSGMATSLQTLVAKFHLRKNGRKHSKA